MELWLDMQAAALPAIQTLEILFNDMRRREEMRGGDPDNSELFKRVPNPVSGLLFASDPPERAAMELEGVGDSLPCYVVQEDGNVLDAKTGKKVGVMVSATGEDAAVRAAAAVADGAGVLLLRGAKPSEWEDVPQVIEIATGACKAAGAILGVTTTVLGAERAVKGFGDGRIIFLIEPDAELWEMGLLYL
ncbi:unnamed protein product [Choristocarpus tenellus]